MSIVLNPFSRADEWMTEFRRLLPDDEIALMLGGNFKRVLSELWA